MSDCRINMNGSSIHHPDASPARVSLNFSRKNQSTCTREKKITIKGVISLERFEYAVDCQKTQERKADSASKKCSVNWRLPFLKPSRLSQHGSIITRKFIQKYKLMPIKVQ
eukprot:Pompholyxophrys_sp_v1_NODE_270_length_920_cov_91.289017.p2 type:complete len:111 gc:universal NODE_270_length_920_cov_91.289017:851-519(-)